jgi:hypothetical protein
MLKEKKRWGRGGGCVRQFRQVRENIVKLSFF